MRDQFGAGDDETAGHLRDVEAEQREERAGVDIARREAEQCRDDARDRVHPQPPPAGKRRWAG